ncbi:MAG: exonuclease SbcCD subunit D C-terminal domain-containing protein [Tannerellaceae bacterium]|jgi:exonuclease SbcD|nr:exonuclease SbcCD subunit D C-terminal domain-containing protein [Tannerellaceae bacterium]
MKIIHTSDWHLGQSFYSYDRKEEHRLFLAWLRNELSAAKADALLIAGDVFDNPNPPAESQAMYYRFLREITSDNPELNVVVIAGNHDSAARLEAPEPLLEGMRVHARGIIRRKSDGEIDLERLIIPLICDGVTKAWCLAVPYLRQGDYPPASNYSEGVSKLYRALLDAVPDASLPIVAMGHLQSMGACISDNDSSERSIIGGLESVSSDAFPSTLAYTALGHLHRPQSVSGRDKIRYAGAPVPMSFAERNNRRGVVLVEISEGINAETKFDFIDFSPPSELISIPRSDEAGSLQTVLEELANLPGGEITSLSPYIEVRIKLREPEPALRFRIESALEGKSVRLAGIVPVFPSQGKSSGGVSFEELHNIKPVDMALDVYRQTFGGEEMPQAMQELLLTAIREADR